MRAPTTYTKAMRTLIPRACLSQKKMRSEPIIEFVIDSTSSKGPAPAIWADASPAVSRTLSP